MRGWGYSVFENIDDIPQNIRFNWLYYKVEHETCLIEQMEKLSKYSTDIVIESNDEYLADKIDGGRFRIINKGEALTKKMERRIFYLFEYKTC